jgi:hypothetical protein
MAKVIKMGRKMILKKGRLDKLERGGAGDA